MGGGGAETADNVEVVGAVGVVVVGLLDEGDEGGRTAAGVATAAGSIAPVFFGEPAGAVFLAGAALGVVGLVLRGAFFAGTGGVILIGAGDFLGDVNVVVEVAFGSGGLRVGDSAFGGVTAGPGEVTLVTGGMPGFLFGETAGFVLAAAGEVDVEDPFDVFLAAASTSFVV